MGIGEDQPVKTLNVVWNESSGNVGGSGLSGGAAGAGVLLRNSNGTSGTYANLDFRAATADGRIAFVYNSENNGDFHFVTDNGSPATKMIIHNEGDVDITDGALLLNNVSRITNAGAASLTSITGTGLLHLDFATSTSSSATGTTFIKIDNYVGSDLNQQKSFIDFVFQDDNTNETPQVRIGAEVGRNGDADSQEKEGSGAFVVYTNNAESTSGDAGTSLAEKFRVDYQGNVDVAGSVTATGTSDFSKITVDNGDSSAPTYTFDGDTDTGIYRDVADTLRIATGGQARATFNSAGFGVTGAVTASTGYKIGLTSIVDSSRNITSIKSVELESNTPTDTSNKLYNVAGSLYWAGAELSSGNTFTKIENGAGDSSAPSYTFTGDTDTGMYSDIADGIRFAVGGSAIMSIVSTGVGVTGTLGASTGYKLGLTQWMDSSLNLSSIGTIASGNITMTGTEFRFVSSVDSNLGLMLRDETYASDEMDITATRLGSGNTPTLGLAGQSGINFYVGGANVGNLNSSGDLSGIGTITSENHVIVSDTRTQILNASGSNGLGVGFLFSDHDTTTNRQTGFLDYFHQDGKSYGSGNAFIFSSNQESVGGLSVLIDGKLLFKDSFLMKPATGTGAGTELIDSSRNVKNVASVTSQGIIKSKNAGVSNAVTATHAYIVSEQTESGVQVIADDGGDFAAWIALSNANSSSAANKHYWLHNAPSTASSNAGDLEIRYSTTTSAGQIGGQGTGSTAIAQFGNSGNFTIAGRMTSSDGTTVKAAYGFASSSTTGISYSSTNNRVNILSGGAVRAYIQTGSSNPIVHTMVVDGSMSVAGSINWTGGSSTLANTAYTYSQVGHVPLAGGTMTGALKVSMPHSTTYSDSLTWSEQSYDALKVINGNSTTSADQFSSIFMQASGGGNATARIVLRNDNSGNGRLYFQMRSGSHTGVTKPKMLITDDGYVTISDNATTYNERLLVDGNLRVEGVYKSGSNTIIDASRNATLSTISSGTITTSGTLDFTANPAYIRNDQDNSGQIIISAKNSSGSAQQVRWDAANASGGAWRPEVNNQSNLGLTNRIWNTLYVNNIRMGSGNDLFVDASRNITAGTISSGAITSSGNIVNDIGNSGNDSFIELKNTGYTGNVTSLRQNADSSRAELNATERPIYIQAGSGGGATGAEIRLYANQQLGYKLDANKASTFYGLLHLDRSTSTSGTTTGTTFLKIDNYVGGDLEQQKSFIDFIFQDDNANETPQVRIGAEVGQNGSANSQVKEGSGAFVVYTNNAESTSGDAGASLAEQFRVDYEGNVSVGNDLIVNGTTRINSAGNATLGTTTTGALTAGAVSATSLSLSGAFTPTSIAATSTVSGSQFRASYGDVNDPAYTFKNDDDTGMYGAGGSVKFAVNGSSRMTIGPTATTVSGRISVVGDLQAGSVPQTIITTGRALQNVTSVTSSGAITGASVETTSSLKATGSGDGLLLGNTSGSGAGIRFSDQTNDGTGQKRIFEISSLRLAVLWVGM